MRLEDLNAMERAAFRDTLGAIFEHSPWVAERTWPLRPFASLQALHEAMCAQVAEAGAEAQLALLRAHPQLASKAALRGELTADSQSEQSSAGLDQCSPQELDRITALNRRYDEKFGFPFIVAVRGHTRQGIIDLLESRLQRSGEAEFAEALQQVERIGWLRLSALVEH